jgi:RHS repeat-associated protein
MSTISEREACMASQFIADTIRDASSRRKVTYPGTNNYSQFTYDGLDHCVKIVEVSGGTTISTKQFVWCDDKMCEARNSSGTITAQYFPRGQTIGGTNYYYTIITCPGSIGEVDDSSGSVQAVYRYDPYGRVTQLQGTIACDFQFAGYYYHAPSGLNLTLHRAYSASLGRWLSRDPVGESVVLVALPDDSTRFSLAGTPKVSAAITGSLFSTKQPLFGYVSSLNAPSPPEPQQQGPSINMHSNHLYSYVENNPTKGADASGLQGWTSAGGWDALVPSWVWPVCGNGLLWATIAVLTGIFLAPFLGLTAGEIALWGIATGLAGAFGGFLGAYIE